MSDDLERRLAATDFSADSRVRRSLRARLLDRRPAPRFAALPLAFAALAVILLLPLLEHHPDYFGELPGQPIKSAPPPLPPARKAAFPRGAQGLPVLPGVLAERAGAREHPIEVHRGRVVRGKAASSVVWEIDGTRYGLAARRITIDDILETRAL